VILTLDSMVVIPRRRSTTVATPRSLLTPIRYSPFAIRP
jgi:hypothetical protein